MTTELSILICGLSSRDGMRRTLLSELNSQIPGWSSQHMEVQGTLSTHRMLYQDCEVIVATDDGTMSIGDKRNYLLSLVNSPYFTFFDDDDYPTDMYYSEIRPALDSRADVITFDVLRTDGGQLDKIALYDLDYPRDFNLDDKYLRRPNHLMIWRTDVAGHVRFPSRNSGEDSEWAKLACPLAKSQHKIDKVLYLYRFDNSITSSPLMRARGYLQPRRKNPQWIR